MYNTQTNNDLAQVQISLDNNVKWSSHFPFLFINRLKMTWERRAYLWSDLDLRFVSFYKSNYIAEKMDAKRLFTVIPAVTIVTVNMFTHSMTTLNKTEYMQMHILILDTLKIMCTKNLCHIFMLTLYWPFVLELWCSHHHLMVQTGNKLLWSCDNLH